MTKLDFKHYKKGRKIQKYISHELMLNNIIRSGETHNLAMFEVQASSSAAIKRLDKYGTPRAFYRDLVQIVVGNYSVIYNIS